MNKAAEELARESIEEMSREELLVLVKDLSKRWLAHDGLWFQAAEEKYGMAAAIELDGMAWKKFTVVEAKRIMSLLGIQPGGGLQALARALKFRLYATVNEQELVWVNPNQLVFRMNRCRVQAARNRKQMPDFPCKSVGVLEYSGFAHTIDERIQTRCISCPPDEHPAEYYCAWEFTLD